MSFDFDKDGSKHPNTGRTWAGVPTRVSIAIATFFALGLTGCAAESSGSFNRTALQDSPNVGVFTGEYVDGLPLFRLPAIQVIGSRGELGRN
jgi:hypothetical protein